MNGKILGVLIASLSLFPVVSSAGTVQLPQTGQESCYDEHGTLIPCYGTGQDGEVRAGVAWPKPRFIEQGNQTLLDNLTGLIWLKDQNIMKTRNPGFDNDTGETSKAGDGKVTWQHALDYIRQLNQEFYLGYNDWRLPNVIELESVFNAGIPGWLTQQGFYDVPNDYHWSSTTLASDTSRAWTGFAVFEDVSSSGKSTNYYVWPVRSAQSGSFTISLPVTGQTACYDASGSAVSCYGSGQDGEFQGGAGWPEPRFTDNGDQTVEDNLTGLVWTKDAGTPGPAACGPGGYRNWQGALDYIKCLNTGNYLGHADWRLPNKTELRSLTHAGQANVAGWLMGQGFSNIHNFHYCSSSTQGANTAWAWYVYIHMDADLNEKAYSAYVWPVRSGQVRQRKTLTVTKSGKGNGSVTTDTGAIVWNGNVGTVPYYEGTSITLSATPDSWSTFAGWVGGCSGRKACRMTISGETQVVADFSVGGDVNADGAVGLADAVLALQMLSLEPPVQTVFHEADVDGDGKIGLAETIYVLQCLARVRNNHPPVWNPIGNRTVNEGSTLTFTVSAEDADGDALTYLAAPLPSGATFDAVTRTFSWSPTHSQSGNYKIAFTATDDYGGQAAETITISVNDVFTFKASEYFPLSPGAWWDYSVNPPGDVERSEVAGTKMIGNQLTMRLRYPSGDEYYYTSDQKGLRLYGQYGGTDIVFDAPLLLIPEDAFMGTHHVSTANYTVVSGQGATSHAEITSTVDVVALEDVPTTWITLKDCVKVCLRYDQYVSETALSIPGDTFCLWLYKGLGAAKQAVGSSTAIIKQSSYMNLSP